MVRKISVGVSRANSLTADAHDAGLLGPAGKELS